MQFCAIFVQNWKFRVCANFEKKMVCITTLILHCWGLSQNPKFLFVFLFFFMLAWASMKKKTKKSKPVPEMLLLGGKTPFLAFSFFRPREFDFFECLRVSPVSPAKDGPGYRKFLQVFAHARSPQVQVLLRPYWLARLTIHDY